MAEMDQLSDEKKAIKLDPLLTNNKDNKNNIPNKENNASNDYEDDIENNNIIANNKKQSYKSSSTGNSISDLTTVKNPYIKSFVIISSICLIIIMIVSVMFFFFNYDSIFTFIYEENKYIAFQTHIVSLLIIILIHISKYRL